MHDVDREKTKVEAKVEAKVQFCNDLFCVKICDGDSRVYSPVPARQSGHAGSGSTLQLPLWEHLPFV